MPWLKVSDTAANHPIVFHALELDDAYDGIVNELWGFVFRCAANAAQYLTDYVVSQGTAINMAGGSIDRARMLLDCAVKCGYMTPMHDEQGRKAYLLVKDSDLFHMFTRNELEWERMRKADIDDTDLTGRVRMRDGDACRWCGKIVDWNNRRGARGGTYDHVYPGESAKGYPERLIVCCKSCNSARGKDLVGWDRVLLPVPEEPYISNETAKQLAKWGFTVTPSDSLPLSVEQNVSTRRVPKSVEPRSVDRSTVEPETPAPGSADPEKQAPGSVERPDFTFDFETMEEELRNAPDWVKEQLKESEATVTPVEPETPAPGRTAPRKKRQNIPGEISTGKPTDNDKSRQKPTIRKLAESGRDGTGNGKTFTQKNPSQQKNSNPANPKPQPKRKRRRRRSKGQKND